MGEVVKTALLAGGRLWELVRGWEPGPGEVAGRAELVQRCAGFKALVVAEDPEERGRRAILNLGHTIGHGIESAAGYGGLSHGECVAIGLVAALRLSVQLAGLDGGYRGRDRGGCSQRHGLPCTRPASTRTRCSRPCGTTRSGTARTAPDGAARGDRAARPTASRSMTAP